MNRMTLFSTLMSLAFAASVRAQSVSGPKAGASAAIFPAVSAEEAPALIASLPQGDGNPLALVKTIMSLDVGVPEQRALLAPLKAAQKAGESNAFVGALRIVREQRQAAMDSAAKPEASLAELESSLARFAELKRLVSLYDPSAAAEFDMAQLGAESRVSKLRADAVKNSAEQTAAALDQSKKDEAVATPATDGRIPVAQTLIKELRSSADTEYSEGLVDKLQAMRTLIVEGLMNDVHKSADSGYIDYAMTAVENIVEAAPDKDVKGLAIAHMPKEIKSSADSDYSEETQARIARIGESAGGLANVPVPELPKAQPPQPKPEVSFGQQLSQGASAHPFGAFFGLLALAGAVVTLGMHSFPLLGIAIAGSLLLWIGVRGLYTDHPVAGFFQLLIIGDLFEKAAQAGALGPGHWLALLIGGAAGAALADWSFKKNHPVLGFFLNLVLMWIFLAAVIGPQAAKPFISVSPN